MSTEHEHRARIEPTPEQDEQARLAFLSEDYGLFTALKRNGAQFETLGPTLFRWTNSPLAESADPNDAPLVSRKGAEYPSGEAISPLAATDHLRKTKAAKEKFLQTIRPPQLTKYLIGESGPDFKLRVIVESTNSQAAGREVLTRLGVRDETTPFRLIEVLAISDETVTEAAEKMRDEWPWAESVQLRSDGTLPATWHNCAPNHLEKDLLLQQQQQDKSAKRRRREELARELLNQPL